MEELNDFRLAGGTALALQLGHRRSLDIDLFSDKYDIKYDFERIYRIVKALLKEDLDLQLKDLNETGVILHCNERTQSEFFKIYFWKWPNPFLFPPVVEDSIRMACLEDLVAMKLEAINDRSNFRDYVDIAFLTKKFTFSQMTSLYTKRTLSSDYTRIITALSNPDTLIKDQELFLLGNVTEKQLKEKVDYMLYVYTKEQEQIRRNNSGK